ncbi:MAG: alpha/beta hydrolase [Bdellovibrionales bacterium]|nr:alpha/beta hydrolase [Bdellovibrionales bacterium]
MSFIKHWLLLPFLLLSPSSGFAKWSAAEYSHLQQATQKNSPFFYKPLSDDVFENTVNPIAWIRIKGILGWYDRPYFKESQFSSPSLAAKRFTYRELVHSPDQPWVVFVPGIFALLSSDYAKYNAQLLARQGYNVAYMANPFSQDYLRSQPFFYPGQIDKEAQVSCDLIRHILAQYHQRKVTVIGLSYGGLLATATAATCPSPIERVVAMNPPLDLRVSFEHVKSWVSEMKTNPHLYEEIMTSNENWLYFKSKIFPGYTAKHFFTRFFVEWLAYSVYHLPHDKPLRQKLIPPGLVLYDKNFYEWLLSFRLETLFENYLKALETPTDRSQLRFWLTQLRSQNVNYSVVTSIDDPINRPAEWNAILREFPKDSLFTLPQGAHLGVSDTTWFEEWFKVLLKPPGGSTPVISSSTAP